MFQGIHGKFTVTVLVESIDERMQSGGQGCFQFEGSTLRLEADVAADGGPPSVRLADFEGPCMLRDATFSSCLKDDVTTKRWLTQLLLNLTDSAPPVQ